MSSCTFRLAARTVPLLRSGRVLHHVGDGCAERMAETMERMIAGSYLGSIEAVANKKRMYLYVRLRESADMMVTFSEASEQNATVKKDQNRKSTQK